MEVIWKYHLDLVDSQEIEMPKHSKIISVQTQYSKMTIWVICDPEEVTEKRIFDIQGTGNPVRKIRGKHIGTCIITNYVWHIFEVPNE